jgi:hypothetical protein
MYFLVIGPGSTIKVNGRFAVKLQTPNGLADEKIVIKLKTKANGVLLSNQVPCSISIAKIIII